MKEKNKVTRMPYCNTLQDRDGGALLVKDAHVKDCADLGRHLQKLAHPSSPNIMKALPAERKYMRAVSRTTNSCAVLRAPSLHTPSPPQLIHPLGVVTDDRGPVPTIHASQHDTMLGPVPTIHCSQQNRSSSVLSLTDSEGDDVGPVPTIHCSQQNHSRSVLSLTDSDHDQMTTDRPTNLKQSASPSLDSSSPRPLLRLRQYPSDASFRFAGTSDSSSPSSSRSSSPVSLFSGPI